MKRTTNNNQSIDLNSAKRENQRRIAKVRTKANELLSDMENLMQQTQNKSGK